MKTAVFLCDCGDLLTSRLDLDRLGGELAALPGVSVVERVPFACSAEGQDAMRTALEADPPDRVVVAACSPREHEATFRKVLESVGLNPFLLQLANVREHVAWVVADRERATAQALSYVRAAVRRAERHLPLERTALAASGDALVIGGGPAGLAAATALAEAGRRVVLVEEAPHLGGRPVRFEEVAPALECGACLLAPVLTRVLASERIEVLTLARVSEVKGSFGNFVARIEQRPRFVNLATCIGCAECVAPCPDRRPNPQLFGLGERRALDFSFTGALPNAPWLDAEACRRLRGEDCRACQAACPVEGAIDFGAAPRTLERSVGAVVVATGARVLDARADAGLCEPGVADVRRGLELEAQLLAQGPTQGKVPTAAGAPPRKVAIVHCVGSLDPARAPHCSGVCCASAFKYGEMLARQIPGVRIAHLFKALSLGGKEGADLYHRARARPGTRLLPYRELRVARARRRDSPRPLVAWDGGSEEFDLVVLCEALRGADRAEQLADALDVGVDRHGFFEELQGRTAPTQARLRGAWLAGACRSPASLGEATTEGLAAAGQVLAELVPGRSLVLEPLYAIVDADRCSECRSCFRACSHHAIGFRDGHAAVDPAVCRGCGTCAATCPSGCISATQFTDGQLAAEIEEALR